VLSLKKKGYMYSKKQDWLVQKYTYYIIILTETQDAIAYAQSAITTSLHTDPIVQDLRIRVLHESFKSLFTIIQPFLFTRENPVGYNMRLSRLDAKSAIDAVGYLLWQYQKATPDKLKEERNVTKDALYDFLNTSKTLRHILLFTPKYHQISLQYNAVVTANIVQVILYIWCSNIACSSHISIVSQEAGSITTQWCLLPALDYWLGSLETFAQRHFRGSTWGSPENLDKEDRDAYWTCYTAQHTWSTLRAKLQRYIKEITVIVSLEEEQLQKERQKVLQQPVAISDQRLQAAREQGRTWVQDRMDAWLGTISLFPYNDPDRSKESLQEFLRVGSLFSEITYLPPNYTRIEEQDILWKTAHPQGLLLPLKTTKDHLCRLERYLRTLPTLPQRSKSAKVKQQRIQAIRKLSKLQGFNAEEITRILCIMKVSPEYQHIHAQIPWIP
jgi:hypothetical protein